MTSKDGCARLQLLLKVAGFQDTTTCLAHFAGLFCDIQKNICIHIHTHTRYIYIHIYTHTIYIYIHTHSMFMHICMMYDIQIYIIHICINIKI